MGIGVSNWKLANAVSQLGHLGVVSGTAIDAVLARRLQLGDMGDAIRRAFQHFPFPQIAERVWDQYYIPGGKAPDDPFKNLPMHSEHPSQFLTGLTVLANYTEVFLAREGHEGLIGINLMEKIQTPTLASLYGAMLAGVDYVLMGAGIPRAIPGILDDLSLGRKTSLKLDVEGTLPGEEFLLSFDPESFCEGTPPALARPQFLAIVSSATLAISLARKSTGKVDGFIIEGSTAGGHNAPPRGPMKLSEKGEPIYSERDQADLGKIKDLGLPFWLAGSFGYPGKLREALALGAAGIQVGTAFAFCEESGMTDKLKQQVIHQSLSRDIKLFTSPTASPTGFPLKVVETADTLSEEETYEQRSRLCDLGYLRHAYRKKNGSIGFRCPGEPAEQFIAKGGAVSETGGRRCLCNSLLASIGLGQVHPNGAKEPPILTAGDQVADVGSFIKPGQTTYSSAQVIEALLA